MGLSKMCVISVKAIECLFPWNAPCFWSSCPVLLRGFTPFGTLNVFAEIIGDFFTERLPLCRVDAGRLVAFWSASSLIVVIGPYFS